jgi:hypothetical protein
MSSHSLLEFGEAKSSLLILSSTQSLLIILLSLIQKSKKYLRINNLKDKCVQIKANNFLISKTLKMDSTALKRDNSPRDTGANLVDQRIE